MTAGAQGFFADLAADNTRAWFSPRKEARTCDIRRSAELLSELLAENLARLTWRTQAPPVFRPCRDVRFSKARVSTTRFSR